jgi:hypothetical protein
VKSRKHIVKYTTTHIAVFITAPQLYNFSVTQISSGVMARAVLLQIITDAQAGQANLSEISLNCSSQPSCSSLIAAIWKATLKGVLPSFSESQNRCLPISSSGTESSASLSKVFSSSCQG